MGVVMKTDAKLPRWEGPKDYGIIEQMKTPKKRGKPAEGWQQRFLKAMIGYPVMDNAAKIAGVGRTTLHREL